MKVEFQARDPEYWRIVVDGHRVGSIGRDPCLGGLWIAEWRHFALEFRTLDEARAYVTADLQEGA